MSTFSHTSNKLMFTLKVLSISAAVFSMALMFKVFFPLPISELPSILNAIASWLRPPYLYIVINCIIITIVATSKLQSKFDHYAVPTPPMKSAPVAYGGHVLKSDELATAAATPLFDYSYAPSIVTVPELEPKFPETKKTIILHESKEMTMEIPEFSETKKTVLLDSSPSSLKKRDPTAPATATTEYAKPPASARFSHRKVVKTTPEGGKTLRVSKPKRNETLESTWKTITDGRPMPLTRHLRKSDTWETRHRNDMELHMSQNNANKMTKSETFNDRTGIHPRNNSDIIIHKMTKSETFNDRSSSRKSTLARSSGSGGKLKKDPSLGQEELNKRVEAFISKFNEDMRLQRQESMNQYLEMINRGAGH